MINYINKMFERERNKILNFSKSYIYNKYLVIGGAQNNTRKSGL